MSYVRNEWKENDIITAEKLNNIEEGVSQSVKNFKLELTSEEVQPAFTASDSNPFIKNISEEEYLSALESNMLTLTAQNSDEYLYFYKRSNITTSLAFWNIISSTGNSFSITVITFFGSEENYKVCFISKEFNF